MFRYSFKTRCRYKGLIPDFIFYLFPYWERTGFYLNHKYMRLNEQIAEQLKAVYFGGNWTDVDLKNALSDIDWQMATKPIYSFNTIAMLVYHMNYYVRAAIRVLQGGPLDAGDTFSFDHPPVLCPEDWSCLLNKTWEEAEAFAAAIEQLPEDKLWEPFSDGKYGNYYRNITGITEHVHYHLGQIVLIKKLLLAKD